MKAALLLDWVDQDVSPVAKALLQSIIADLEGRNPDPFEEAAKADAPTPAPKPEQKATTAQAPEETTVTIDRRSRPCVINGVAYPSIMAAAQALGIPYHAVQKMASRKRN